MNILCEGPRCNAGRSAKDREREIAAQFPSTTSEMRDEGAKHARAAVSHALAHTEHQAIATSRGGQQIWSCTACGHERVYGGAYWSPSWTPPV